MTKQPVMLQSEVYKNSFSAFFELEIQNNTEIDSELQILFLNWFLEFPHKFTNGLEGKNVVEEDKVEFKLECEEDDAEVKWFKDGVEIIPDGKR